MIEVWEVREVYRGMFRAVGVEQAPYLRKDEIIELSEKYGITDSVELGEMLYEKKSYEGDE